MRTRARYCDYLSQGYLGYTFEKKHFSPDRFPCPPSAHLGARPGRTDNLDARKNRSRIANSKFPPLAGLFLSLGLFKLKVPPTHSTRTNYVMLSAFSQD